MTTVTRITNFSGKGGEVNADKNGKNPVYLTYIKGDAIPDRARVLSGTIAENLGLEVGKTYLINTTEGVEDAVYGKQYTHTVVTEMSGADLLGLFAKELSKTVKSSVTVEEKQQVHQGGGLD
jgi:hypothetical protein